MVLCLVCDRPIKSGGGGYSPHQIPGDAIHWTSHGNYGSTVWDSLRPDEGYLELYICDDCVKRKADRIFTVVQRDGKFEYHQGLRHDLAAPQPRPCERCGKETYGYVDATGCCSKVVWECVHHVMLPDEASP